MPTISHSAYSSDKHDVYFICLFAILLCDVIWEKGG